MMTAQFGLLAHSGSDNLGDAIQTLAAQRFVPDAHCLIERERLAAAPNSDCRTVKTIMNGWFMHDGTQWPPHQHIEPLPLSMHFVHGRRPLLRKWRRTTPEYLFEAAGREWLERWGPIGARDEVTLEELDRRRIPAWLSGCLTLTLRPPAPVERRDVVIACDLDEAALTSLRAKAGRPVEAVTHAMPLNVSHEARMAAAKRMLSTYANAALVVTTRIHAAMPCLALGTPVLLLHDRHSPRRVTDVAKLVHARVLDDFVRNRHDFDLAAPPPNPSGFRARADELERRCLAFTGFDAFQADVAPEGRF